MVADARSPLASFPPAATGHALNTRVAQQSLSGMANPKRKRNVETLVMPPTLQELLSEESGPAVFRPKNIAQISDVLRFATEESLSVSVLNPSVPPVHGNSSGGDCVIELSHVSFQRICVDKESMTVKVGGAVTSRLVDTALAEQGLITPLVGYTVGLGAFLSGGFGFASRLHGLTADNILDAELVLASGEVIRANEASNTELFWGLKGSGTTFGVVTELTLRCYPLVRSLSATVIYPFLPETGGELLKHWRDCLEDAPHELYSNFVIAAGPQAPTGNIAILQICHLGSHDAGLPFIQRMASFPGVKYHFKDCNEITYLRQQELVEAVLKGAAVAPIENTEPQARYLINGNILTDITDGIVEETCSSFHTNALPGSIWCFELFAGALTNVENGCIPHSHRSGKFHAASIMRTSAAAAGGVKLLDLAGRDWIRDTISRVSPGGPLPTFLPNHHADTRDAKHYHDIIRGSYGHENWSRLKTLKTTYDPGNCFRGAYDEGMLGFEEQLIDGV